MSRKEKRNYSEADLPEWCEIGEQTENFMIVRSSRSVYPSDLEQLLSIGLACCGVSPASWGSVAVMLRKE